MLSSSGRQTTHHIIILFLFFIECVNPKSNSDIVKHWSLQINVKISLVWWGKQIKKNYFILHMAWFNYHWLCLHLYFVKITSFCSCVCCVSEQTPMLKKTTKNNKGSFCTPTHNSRLTYVSIFCFSLIWFTYIRDWIR